MSKRENGLTHFDARGQARMVDVATKAETHRIAVACGRIAMLPATLKQIRSGSAKKGDVLGVARLAAIQAAKRTSDLIPLCPPFALTFVDVQVAERRTGYAITATVRLAGGTGVEMEALTAVSVAALTIYDMLKAADKAMVIGPIRLARKTKG